MLHFENRHPFNLKAHVGLTLPASEGLSGDGGTCLISLKGLLRV